jgi:hypothetical protein
MDMGDVREFEKNLFHLINKMDEFKKTHMYYKWDAKGNNEYFCELDYQEDIKALYELYVISMDCMKCSRFIIGELMEKVGETNARSC